jgi:hypothetical protein
MRAVKGGDFAAFFKADPLSSALDQARACCQELAFDRHPLKGARNRVREDGRKRFSVLVVHKRESSHR